MYNTAKFNSENTPKDNKVSYCIALFDSVMVRKRKIYFQVVKFVLPLNILLNVPFALTEDRFMFIVEWNVL